MSKTSDFVRLSAATIVGFISSVFVTYYNEVSTWVFQQEQPGSVLPALTIGVIHFAPYLHVIPTVALIAGVFVLKAPTMRPVLFECLIAVTWVIAFAWALVALWVWQIARIHLVN